MTAIQFYHLTSTPLERAVPKLVEKAYGAGMRVLLLMGSEEMVEYMNQQLWTYAQLGFLPHGTLKEAAPERQPVLIACAETAVNKPDALFVTEGSEAPAPEAYKRILDIFDGNNESAVTNARARWKRYKDAGHELAYFKQEDGAWQKAA